MKRYIDKSALVAEIEKLRKNQRLDDRHGQGVLDGLHAIEIFLDTPEVKEVDLEKEIKLYKMRNPIIGHREESLYNYMSNVAKHFFELGIKATTEEI